MSFLICGASFSLKERTDLSELMILKHEELFICWSHISFVNNLLSFALKMACVLLKHVIKKCVVYLKFILAFVLLRSQKFISFFSLIECEEHGEKLKMYCSECKTACCTYCQIEGKHKNHKSFHVDEAEHIDKRNLHRLQQKVDDHGEKFIKSRSEVQRTIEELKKNDIRVKDLIRRYFRELRTAIETGEKILLEEVGKRNKLTLRSLNEQLR